MFKTKTFSVAFATLSLLGTSVSLASPQESHGGNSAALEFVKIGRAIHRLLVNNPYALSENLDFEQFEDAVGQTAIELVNPADVTLHGAAAVGNDPGRPSIRLSAQAWRTLPCYSKFWLVLQLYAAVSRQPLSEGSTLLGFLGTPSQCEALYQLNLPEPTFVPLGADEFQGAMGDLIAHLMQHPFWTVTRSVSVVTMDSLLEDTTLFPLLNGFFTGGMPTDIPSLSGTEREASNAYVDDSPRIVFDEMAWLSMSYGEKVEFALHEYLGLTPRHDDFYQTSSQLFLDVQKTGW